MRERMTEKPLTKNIRPGHEPLSLKEYERAGGYQSVRKAVRDLAPEIGRASCRERV